MKKGILILSTVLTLIAFSFNAKANESGTNWYNNLYVGVGAGYNNNIKLKRNTFISNLSEIHHNINLFIGYNIIKYFDLELKYNYFLPKDYMDNYGNNFKDKGNYIALLVKPKYEINDKNTIFISLGIGYLSLENIAPIYNTNYTGLSYIAGAGYQFNFNKNNALVTSFTYNTSKLSITNVDKFGTADATNIDLSYKYSFK